MAHSSPPTLGIGTSSPPTLDSGSGLSGMESEYNNHDLLVQWLASGNETAWNLTAYNNAKFQYPLSLLVPTTVCYAIIFVAGILGNVVTCIIINKNKSMHTATNYYLFNLAISDLMLLISGMPLDIYNMWIPNQYPFSSAVCMALGMISETTANATVLTITSFTVERYIAICHPFRQHMMDLSRAVKFIFAIWLVSFCLAIPQFIQIGVVEEYGTSTCTIKNKYIDHMFELSSFVFFVGPMIVIMALYILIGLKLHSSKLLHGVKRKGCPDVSSGSGKNSSSTSSGQARVIRMLVAVVVAFFLCWCPFHAQRLIAVNSTEGVVASQWQLYVVLNQCSGILYFLSTCINPLLYNIMSHKFRDAFKTTIARQLQFGRRETHHPAYLQQLPDRHSYSAISRRGDLPKAPAGLRNQAQRSPPPPMMDKPVSLIERPKSSIPLGGQAQDLSEDRTRENVGHVVEASYHENGDLNAIRCDDGGAGKTVITIIPVQPGNVCKTSTPLGGKRKGTLLSFFSQSSLSIFSFKSPKKAKFVVPNNYDSHNLLRTDVPRLPRSLKKLASVDSANTISNSSLQEVDEEEFNSSDLVKYMEEINQGIKC